MTRWAPLIVVFTAASCSDTAAQRSSTTGVAKRLQNADAAVAAPAAATKLQSPADAGPKQLTREQVIDAVTRLRITGSKRNNDGGLASLTSGVTVGSRSISSGRDKASIRKHIRSQRPQFRACYESELRLDPTLAGTVIVNFTIDVHGTVTAAKATGLHPAVATCVATVMKSIQFEPPSGGGILQVRYPFLFRSR